METLLPILTPQDIADYLGISRWTVYELMKTPDGIPHFKPGGEKSRTKRIRRSDFLEWIERSVENVMDSNELR